MALAVVSIRVERDNQANTQPGLLPQEPKYRSENPFLTEIVKIFRHN